MSFFIVTGQKSQKTLFPQSVEEILSCYSKDRNPHHNRQIKFIIDQLDSGQWSQIPFYDTFIEADWIHIFPAVQKTFRNTSYCSLSACLCCLLVQLKYKDQSQIMK